MNAKKKKWHFFLSVLPPPQNPESVILSLYHCRALLFLWQQNSSLKSTSRISDVEILLLSETKILIETWPEAFIFISQFLHLTIKLACFSNAKIVSLQVASGQLLSRGSPLQHCGFCIQRFRSILDGWSYKQPAFEKWMEMQLEASMPHSSLLWTLKGKTEKWWKPIHKQAVFAIIVHAFFTAHHVPVSDLLPIVCSTNYEM